VTLEFADPALNGGASRLMDPAFRAHYFTILRLCMRQLGDRSDAEDAAQETFRRALQQREGMIGDPLPWLITVARNVCIDELRRRRTGRGAVERTVARTSESLSDGEITENPERVVVGRMFINELLRQLTPAERRVVAGTIVDGQCGGDLAASLGVTASTARVLLARARSKLRRYLEDGQGAIPAVCFAGWRAADRLRQRVLTRPWALQARPEMLLPALVVSALVTAAMSPPSTPAPASGAVYEPFLATAHRVDLSDDSVGRSTAEVAAPVAPAPDATTGHATGPASALAGGSPLDALLPAPDPDQVWVTDFEPSPNYGSDHTVYMVGLGGHCYLSCYELFRSSDGGTSWTYVPNRDLTGSALFVPSLGYAGGQRFYAAGGGLLQVTRDGGAHFDNDALALQAAAVAPAWLDADVVTADTTLSFIGATQVPQVVAAFPPGDTAAGAPLLLPRSANGFTALVAVQNDVLGGYSLLSCTTGSCTPTASIPVGGPIVQLIASPNVATDHTLVAVGGGVAVSHDGGASFAPVSTLPIAQAVAVPSPSGTRLIAVDASHTQSGNTALVYSDDLGATWHLATLPRLGLGALYVRSPRLLSAGRLIASAADPRRPGMNVFVCSAGGAQWSACAPQ